MVIRMSRSVGVVILRMARYYSTEEVIEMVIHSECEDGSSSSSEDSGGDTEDSSAVQTEQLESNSDSSDVSSENESKGEMD